MSLSTFSPLLLLLFLLAVSVSSLRAAADYEYYCTGNCDTDVNTTSEFGLVLMGGSTDVDTAFMWMIEKSGGGDFLILRTSYVPEYLPR